MCKYVFSEVDIFRAFEHYYLFCLPNFFWLSRDEYFFGDYPNMFWALLVILFVS